jgi:hypothetical protein
MKNITVLLTGLLCICAYPAFAQFSYTFSAASGTYTANATPTVIHTNGVNDNITNNLPIGFSFVYGCNTYTTFGASSNGWIGLGAGPYTSDDTPNFTTPSPRIAPLWDDLKTGGSGNVNYKLTGNAPNRVLTVEWKQMLWTANAFTWAISFQAKLYETTNVIEFIYSRNGTGGQYLSTGANAGIGIVGPVSGYYSLNGSGTSPTASTTNTTYNIDSKPASGQIYKFTGIHTACSGTPAGGTAIATPNTTDCTSSNVSLSLSGQSIACGIQHQWQSSTDNVNWTPIPGATTATYQLSTSATTSYRCMLTCTNSALTATSMPVTVTYTSGPTPTNDLPCNASLLTYNTLSPGNNECTGNTSEPAKPACWTNGTVNSVWYKVVASGTTMQVKTFAGSLINTQIALFSGTCGSLTMVANACNNDDNSCIAESTFASYLNLTGLTNGATYYIAVDGAASSTGTFSIEVRAGGVSYAPMPGQDCSAPNPVCQNNFGVSDPGYNGSGNSCDFNGSSTCLESGERSITWYSVPISGAGFLSFNLVPNDFNPAGAAGNETDYDFAVWKTNGAGATNCAGIAGGAATVRCNYDGNGITGLGLNGNAPSSLPVGICPTCGTFNPSTSYNDAYEALLPVLPGEVYLIAISNFSNSTSGFHIDFGATPVNYALGAVGTVATWSGSDASLPTDWTDADNWGGCYTPACGVDANITPLTSQPVISTNVSVNNLTIQPGATLKINAGVTVTICGNYTNLGTLVMAPTATILFSNTSTHTMSGQMTGPHAFGNLIINQLSGSVSLQDDIALKGSFTTASITSVFNTNGHAVSVGADFFNALGNTSFSNTGSTGSLEFNGTGTQYYSQGILQLDLNQVLLNNTGAGVVLQTPLFIKSTTGRLTLTNGKITTGLFRVDVANGATNAVSTGNAGSYVYGNLYRTLSGAAGTYDFPLGTATLYERASIQFTTSTTIPRLQTRFDSWVPNILGMLECMTHYNLPSEDMGYWTINASANSTSGTYNAILYCNGATNVSPANAWTVEKTPTIADIWNLTGSCDPTSTAEVVRRNGMSGFSVFAAAQATVPLPVEFLAVYGFPFEGHNEIHWKTATEKDNDYFLVEKSSDGETFNTLLKVNGAGNSNSPLAYAAMDETPYFPVTYYRVKQVDFNGQFRYSPVIAIESAYEENVEVHRLYPNPGNQVFTVDISVRKAETVTFSLHDTYGKLLQQFDQFVQGNQSIVLDTGHCGAGMYHLVLTTASGTMQTLPLVRIP